MTVRAVRVGLYTEVFRPVRNGVVASVDALASGLARRDIDVRCLAPYAPRASDDAAYVRRLPSLPLLTKTGYRLVLPISSFDPSRTIVHAHSLFVTGAMALRAARRGRVPLVFTAHTRLSAYAHYAPIDARLVRATLDTATRLFANAASAVIAPTAAIASELRALGVRTRIEIVATGVDVQSFARAPRDAAMRARLGAPSNEPLALWAGRIAPEKNWLLALQAFARTDARSRLAIVGGGIERIRAERAARKLGIAARTVFYGEADGVAMASAYAAADALLFTSETETQGLVLVEARAARLPIAAVDGAVAREVAGGDARFAPPEPEALAAALAAALRGGRTAGDLPARFCSDAAVETTLALYRSLLEDG